MHLNRLYKILVDYLLPAGCFIYYFSLCLHYYEARISYGDSAYYLFNILQKEGFNIESGRAIAYFTQVLPVLAIKFGASITVVMKLYSLNLALVYLLLYGIIRWILKSSFVAAAILLIISQLQHYSFYYATPEHLLGTAYFLVLAFYIWKKSTEQQIDNKTIVLFFGLSFGLYFSHPFLLLLLVNFLVLLWVYKKDNRLFLLIVVAIMVMLAKYFFRTGYEGDHYAAFSIKNLQLANIKKSYLTYFFLESFKERFALLKFVFYFFLLVLLIRRKWGLLILMPLSLLAAYLPIYWMMPNGESLGYMECYLVMGVIAVFSFMVFYAEEQLSSEIKNPVLLVIFIFCLAGLYRNKSESLYKNRVKYIQSLLEESKSEGIYKAWINPKNVDYSHFVQNSAVCIPAWINLKNVDYSHLLLDWSFPYETLLLSSQDNSSQTIIVDHNGVDYAATNKTNVFYGAYWQSVNYDYPFNKRYFNLPEQEYKEFVPKK